MSSSAPARSAKPRRLTVPSAGHSKVPSWQRMVSPPAVDTDDRAGPRWEWLTAAMPRQFSSPPACSRLGPG
jgi:hypothetical protein